MGTSNPPSLLERLLKLLMGTVPAGSDMDKKELVVGTIECAKGHGKPGEEDDYKLIVCHTCGAEVEGDDVRLMLSDLFQRQEHWHEGMHLASAEVATDGIGRIELRPDSGTQWPFHMSLE